MKDFDAIGALLLGLLVFGVLAVTPAWADQRYVAPTEQEQLCVNYVTFLTVYNTSAEPELKSLALQGMEKIGLISVTREALRLIDEGVSTYYIYPAAYKTCMAKYGDPVV